MTEEDRGHSGLRLAELPCPRLQPLGETRSLLRAIIENAPLALFAAGLVLHFSTAFSSESVSATQAHTTQADPAAPIVVGPRAAVGTDTAGEKAADIAKYAANMAANHGGGYGHDGIGVMIESPFEKPDYEKNQYQVIAIVTDEGDEQEVLAQTDWSSS